MSDSDEMTVGDDDYYDTQFDGDDEFGFVDREENEIQRQKSYEVIDEVMIENKGKLVVDEVVDFLGLPNPTVAITLLRHYKWNKERLIQEYTSGNPDTINKEAGITSFEMEINPKSPSLSFSCLICLEEVPIKKTFALACGHRYCRECWKLYLELKVQTEAASCVSTRCPYPKCTEAVHEKAYESLVSEQMYSIYQKFVLRSLVEDNPHIKFCPAPGCTKAVKVERKNRKEAVTCTCGFSWCFQCCDYEIGDHMPATCENIEAWHQKALDESENVKWMIANTKKCPNCRRPIEKNGGCMHMTCRTNSGGCGHEFCWLCRGDWKEHGANTGGYYSCNKYDESKAKDDDTKAAQIKTELEAYMFYYHRYESHHNAMKIADEQRLSADKKANNILERFSVRAQDTNFLKEAAEQLISNRRVLKNSYIYGYFKSKSPEKQLFEYLQEDLEKHTNYLSEIYERPLEKVEDYNAFVKWKEEVTNYTRVTAGFLKKFVEGVMGGLTSQE